MSVKVNYKGEEILSVNTDATKTLMTSGKYCEGDIVVDNVQDGGITPTGNINITDTALTDVTQYATAQVVDTDLVAENIRKDVNILGIIGSFEGGGATQIATGSITPTENVDHLDITGLNFTPKAMALIVAPEFRNTGIQMTSGAICIYDLALISRSNTGGTSTLATWTISNVAGASDKSITTCTVVNSFSYTNSYVERKSDAFRVTLYSDNMAFPYASGVKYDWIAIG